MNNTNAIISGLHRSYLTVFPQGATVTPRAHGIDISKYDLHFEPLTAKGQLDFVIQRASYRCTRDEAFEKLVPGVMQIPVRGAYHYLNSDTGWLAQANAFLSIVGNYDYHFFACDFESAFNIMSLDFAWQAWNWIQYVAKLSGKTVLLYTSPSLYTQWITPSAAKYKVDWNTVPLWTAQWFFTPNPNENPTMPAGRQTWTMWQYTDQGDGPLYGVARPTACDLDVYNGTVEQLHHWLQIGTTPTQPETPMALYEGIAPTVNVRVRKGNADGSPNPSGTTIEQINIGQSFKADRIAKDAEGRDWYHVIEAHGKAVDGFSAAWLLQVNETKPPVTTTPTPVPYTITLGDDVTYVKQTITGVLQPK